jgi:hypothetical protein
MHPTATLCRSHRFRRPERPGAAVPAAAEPVSTAGRLRWVPRLLFLENGSPHYPPCSWSRHPGASPPALARSGRSPWPAHHGRRRVAPGPGHGENGSGPQALASAEVGRAGHGQLACEPNLAQWPDFIFFYIFQFLLGRISFSFIFSNSFKS